MGDLCFPLFFFLPLYFSPQKNTLILNELMQILAEGKKEEKNKKKRVKFANNG